MSVTSEQSTITIDGTFLITGKLSVTRIERSARLEPIEAYAGPAYGKPITHTDTHEITLTFSDSRQLATSKDVMQFRGTTSVRREDFSQLLQALIQDSWPTVLVNNDNCEEHRRPMRTIRASNAPVPTSRRLTTVSFRPKALVATVTLVSNRPLSQIATTPP